MNIDWFDLICGAIVIAVPVAYLSGFVAVVWGCVSDIAAGKPRPEPSAAERWRMGGGS